MGNKMRDYLVTFKISQWRGGPEFIRDYRVSALSSAEALEQALTWVRRWYPYDQVGVLSFKYWCKDKWRKVKLD